MQRTFISTDGLSTITLVNCDIINANVVSVCSRKVITPRDDKPYLGLLAAVIVFFILLVFFIFAEKVGDWR